MSFWATIAGTRYDADSLWLPGLSLDLIGRDLSMVKVPLELQIPLTSQTIVGNSSTSFVVCYPESWALDQSFNPMVARLTVPVIATSGASSSTLEIIGGPIIVTSLLGTDQVVTLTRDYTGTLPVGPTTEQIRVTRIAGSGTVNFKRLFNSDGPRCSIEIFNTTPAATQAAGAMAVVRLETNAAPLFYDEPPDGAGASPVDWGIGESVQVLTASRYQIWTMTPDGWQLSFQRVLTP